MFIQILMLVAFFSVTILVGLYCRRSATDVNSFVLGGRSVGPWLSAFAFGTSYFSAVVFIGYAGQFGWRFGISAVWIGLGNALIGSLLAWVTLGRRTRIMTHQLGSATMPAFFGTRFESPGLRIGASVIIFVFLIPYTASLYNGLSRLFVMAFNIDFAFCIAIMAALTGLYVIAGGYLATAINDFIQGIIMLVGIVVVVAAVLNTHGGFLSSLNALAMVEDAAVSGSPGIFASFFGPDPFSLLCVVLLTSLGTWGLPQMVQKFYSIRSESAVHKGTIISTLFALVVSGGCYFLGGFGRLFSDKIDIAANGYDSIIPTMLSDFSPALIGLIVVLVLSASMSTLSALVMTSASTFTLDFIKTTVAKDMDEKKQLLSIRLLIVAFVAISAGIAIWQYKQGAVFIAQLMGISWGALAGSFLAPFLYGLYWKRTTKAATWSSFAFGTGFMLINLLAKNILPAPLQSPINAGAFCMLTGLVLVPVVSWFTRPPSAEHIAHCFAAYDETVTVPVTDTLGGAKGETR